MNEQLRKIYDREFSEIKQHKKRFGAIIASLVVSLLLFAFTDNEEPVKATPDIETAKVVEPKKNAKTAANNEIKSKFKNVAGLEKVSENADIINPFKVDIEKPPKNKTENKSIEVPAPVFTPPALPEAPAQNKTAEPVEKVVLILKGVAISGDKKMAIIQRGTNINDKDSKTSEGKNSAESFLLSLGDEIDGRRIIDISKDSITFDNGHKLRIQEALQ